MLNKFLFKQIDNTALIVFRVIFGLLIFLESVGAILTGWVEKAFIEPKFTFTFIGFEWLQPLPGYGMYYYYTLMGLLGIAVMLGYRYKWSIAGFTLMWTLTYLMQKTNYNNHYYLLILLCLIMFILPAHRYFSLDVKRKPQLKSISMPNWCKWLIIIQVWIVYTYGSIAKWYPDWLDLSVIATMMKGKINYPIVGHLLQMPFVHGFLAYGGVLFDLLIVPLLLFKPTRKWAFFISIFFHLFNSIVFQVGIFPYLSLAFSLLFFEPQTIRNLFMKKKPIYEGNEIIIPAYRNALVWIGGAYLVFQILMPLRHWVIPGDVLWTEEGHRMSWRMMLRSKNGYIAFSVVDKKTGQVTIVRKSDYITAKQESMVATKPDFVWQFAQHLKKEYAEQGKDVQVFAKGKIKVNAGPYARLVDPETDLAAEKWNWFSHNSWVMLSEKE